MNKAITTTALFLALGQAERMTRDATLGAHKAYAKSTPEQQAQLMHDCIVQYIIGYTECDLKAAERILSQSRDERSKKSQDAYYKGYSKFRYHIIRPNDAPVPESSGRQVKVVAPRAVFKAVLNEVLESGMTKAQFEALIAELRDSVEFK